MHDEDSTFGIRVTNERGDKWVAFGDGMLMDEECDENLKMVVSAVQTSVDQVFEAFSMPRKNIDTSNVTQFIPFVDSEEINNYPLFGIKEGKVVRRCDIENLGDPSTTKDWLAISTARKLKSYEPKGSVISDEMDPEEVYCRGCFQSLDPHILD